MKNETYRFQTLTAVDPAAPIPREGTLSLAIDLAHHHWVRIRLQDSVGFDRFEVREDGTWRTT